MRKGLLGPRLTKGERGRLNLISRNAGSIIPSRARARVFRHGYRTIFQVQSFPATLWHGNSAYVERPALFPLWDERAVVVTQFDVRVGNYVHGAK